ncbi:MAG: ATP-binding protein [Syntrophothermus sp.]
MNHFNLNKYTPLKVILLLLAIGVVWIGFSDFLLRVFISTREVLTYVQAIFDLFLVILFSSIVYFLFKSATVINRNTIEELTESELKLKTFFQKTSDLIAIFLYENLEIIDANQSFLDFVGYKREEVLGRPIRNVVRWLDENGPLQVDKLMAEQGYIKNLEVRFKGLNGNDRIILLSSEHAIINDRKCILSIGRDITESKKAAEEVLNNKTRQHYEFLKTLLNAVPNPVFIISRDQILINSNLAFKKLPESEKQQIIEFTEKILPDNGAGDNGTEMPEPDFRAHWPVKEFKYTDEDYNETYFLVNKALFYDADGSIGGWMGILDDITDYHKLQSETKKALEKEIELNTLKSRFMTNASHEFRTPLTVILASADLLDMFGRNWPEEKYLEHTGKIRRTVRYMTELLDDVLNISRDETGRLAFRPEQINLKTICQEVIELARSRNMQNCQIMYDYSGNTEIVFADERIVRQILMNLLVNALKYSHKNGFVKILVKVSEAEADIEIADEGIGIPEEKLQTIFEPFNRGSNVGAIAGTGLGLSIVKKSIDMHSGSIAIKSKVDAGTTVYVNLPFKNN